LQNADGSWTISAPMAECLGTNLQKLTEVKINDAVKSGMKKNFLL
jgi:hypothetical protein